MEEQGLIQTKDGRLELTPRGLRRLGQQALGDLFSKLSPDKIGSHDIERSGFGHERNFETKPYEFGDPFEIHLHRTVMNAIERQGVGTPVKVGIQDFERWQFCSSTQRPRSIPSWIIDAAIGPWP